MNKKKISARINPHNYQLLRTIADTMFYTETKNEGNISQALDWVLTKFRLGTKYRGLLIFLERHADYLRGSREKEDIEAIRHLLTFLKTVEGETK